MTQPGATPTEPQTTETCGATITRRRPGFGRGRSTQWGMCRNRVRRRGDRCYQHGGPQEAATWTDHMRYHREEPCDCEPPADALEELTRLCRENGLSVSVSKEHPR